MDTLTEVNSCVLITTESQRRRENLKTKKFAYFFSVPLCLCGEKFLATGLLRAHWQGKQHQSV